MENYPVSETNSEVVDDPVEMLEDISQDHNQNKEVCNQCQKQYATKKKLKRHVIQVHEIN